MAESTSSVYVATAPSLVGVWVFDPTAPDTSERNFMFASGQRTEDIDVDPSELVAMGRTDPLVEYGEATLVGLRMTVFIPFDDAHDSSVEYWRKLYTNRRTFCYRDNRKRLIWSAINSKIELVDGRVGTAIGFTIRRVSFDEAVA